MNTTTQIQLFQIFKQKFGENEAEQIVDILERTIDQKLDTTKDSFLTKNDKIELIKEIRDSKVDTIKWMFAFWLGQITVIAGILMYFLKK